MMIARPSAAVGVSAGELVRSPVAPTIYYVNGQGVLEPYFSAASFFSWGHDFKNTRLISGAIMDRLPKGAWQSVKPGRLIKTEGDPKVYQVTSLLRAREVKNEVEAEKIDGPGWSSRLVTLPPLELALYALASQPSVGQSGAVSNQANSSPSPVVDEVKMVVLSAVGYLKTQSLNWWSAMALAAAGESVQLNDLPIDDSSLTGREKTVIGLVASGYNPHQYYQRDLVAEIKNASRASQLGDPRLLNDDIWGILALKAAGAASDDQAVKQSVSYLIANQNPDGGWGFMVNGQSDTNDTAMAILALRSVGESAESPTIKRALDYLLKSQNSDGGFGFTLGQKSDTASTAWVMMVLERLNQESAWQRAGTFLLVQQQANGSFAWQKGQTSGDDLSTAYAVMALLKQNY